MNILNKNYFYFLRVVELNSITEAAKSLRISQPAMSLAIDQLETEIGVKLFERQGRKKALNETGRSFAKALKERHKDLMESCSTALLNPEKQPVRFGAVTHWALKSITSRIHSLEKNFGPIQAHFGYSLQIYEQVRAGLLDFGFIAWSREPTWPNRRFLCNDPQAVVGLKGKFDHIERIKSLSDLKNEKWIWHRKPQNKINDYLKSNENGIVVDGYDLLKELLFSGYGLASVQLGFFDKKELSRLVVAPKIFYEKLALYLVYSDNLDARKTKLMENLVSILS